MESIARELASLSRLAAQVTTLLALPEPRLLARDETRSGWSPAEHLFHLSFANEMSLKNAASLVAEKGMLIRPLTPLVPQAAEILRRGILPHGTEAPRFVRPPAVIDLPFLREIASEVSAATAKLAEHPAALAEAPNGIPHQALGVLSAEQWVRFARMHSVHHLRIVRRLLG